MGTDAAFATLGIAAGAPSNEITRSFRVLCRVTHPDHGGDRTRFESVLDAYRTLQAAGLVTRDRSPEAEPVDAAEPVERVERVEPFESAVATAAAAPDAAPVATHAPGPIPGMPVAHRAPGSPADSHYRRFLAGLDHAATFVPRPARPRRAPMHVAANAAPSVDFAELLERELRRTAA